MNEIQKADPGARRLALIILFGFAALGLLTILLFKASLPALAGWLTRDPTLVDSRLRLSIAVFGAAFTVPLLGFSVYFWRLGAKVVAAERFPTPAVALLRDTPVLRGSSARRRGRGLQLLAVSLVVLALGFCGILWRLVSVLASRSY